MGLLQTRVARRHSTSFLASMICGLLAVAGVPSSAYGQLTEEQKEDLAQYFGFGTMELYKLDHGISDMQIVDVDGDGLRDVVVSNNAKSKIEVLLQRRDKPTDAELWQASEVNELTGDWRFRRVSLPVNHRVGALVSAELTGDSLPELVIFGNDDEVLVFPNEGEGKFGTPVRQRVRKALPELAVGDLNGDRRADVVLLGEDDIFLFTQTPSGGLARPQRLAHAADAPWSLTVQDVDGDGRDDLVLIDGRGDYPLQVRLQTTTGELGAQQRVKLPSIRSPRLARFPGRRAADVVAVESVSGRLKRWQLHVSDGPQGEAQWPVLNYPYPDAEEGGRRPVAVGDVTGDGLADLVSADVKGAQLMLFAQRAGLGLRPALRFGGQVGMRDLRLADLDGDGRSEVIVASAEEKAVGISAWDGSRLTFPRPLPLPGTPYALDVVVTKAGTLCAAASKIEDNYTLVVAHIASSKESGQLKFSVRDAPAKFDIEDYSSEPSALRLFDVNQDGRQDVLIFSPYDPLVTFLQNESGGFDRLRGQGTHEGLVSKVRVGGWSSADVTADGAPEMLLAQRSFARALRVNSDGQWEVVDQFNAPHASAQITGVTAFAGTPAKVALYDDRGDEIHWLVRGNEGTFNYALSLPVGQFEINAMSTTRLAGPDSEQIFLADARRFALIMPEAPALRAIEKGVYETTVRNGRLWRSAVGDLNNDNRADIAVVDGNESHIEVLTLGPKEELVRAMRFRVFARKSFRDSSESVEPREIKIADVTGDDRADLVLLVHDRIILYPAE
jgi:hypothetical protein